VSRSWLAIVVLLGVQALLSALAAAREWSFACGACGVGGLGLGLAGFAFYAGLFAAALFAGPTRLVFGGILLGLGVHVLLAAQLLTLGKTCPLCFAATGASAAMAVLAVAYDRANLGRVAILVPWSALLVLGWGELSRSTVAASASVSDTAAVRLTVFTQPECPYCDELRDRVLPRVEREFGSRVQVVLRAAEELPGLRRTPTVVVSPGRRDRQSRVIEGLPDYDELRQAILEVEEAP
jgi:hypothetical protein